MHFYLESGLERAESISAALYKGSVEALGNLSQREVKDSFGGATLCDIFQEPGMTVLDAAMKANCFPTESKQTWLLIFQYLIYFVMFRGCHSNNNGRRFSYQPKPDKEHF